MNSQPVRPGRLPFQDLLRLILPADTAEPVPPGGVPGELCLPDLVPLGNPMVTGPVAFCIRDQVTGGLLVFVRNQGPCEAGPSVTRVLYQNGMAVNRATPQLLPGEMVALVFPFPQPLAGRVDATFLITVDAGGQVTERDETNNNAFGRCI